jgi:hypothetical protein
MGVLFVQDFNYSIVGVPRKNVKIFLEKTYSRHSISRRILRVSIENSTKDHEKKCKVIKSSELENVFHF